MTIETTLVALLKDRFSNRFYADVAPLKTSRPYGTYQQVGGAAIAFVDPTKPDKKNARIMVRVWAETRDAANTLARGIADTLATTPTLQAEPLGDFTAEYDEDTKSYGTRQDFSIWFTN